MKKSHKTINEDTALTAVIKSIDSWNKMEEEPPSRSLGVKSVKSVKGKVHVADREDEVNVRKLIVNYDLEGTPLYCDECRIKIHNGSCDEIGDVYFTGNDPYNKNKSYRSNYEGKAASWFYFNNKRSLINNRCKLAVVYDDKQEKIGCGMLIPDAEKYDCAKNVPTIN